MKKGLIFLAIIVVAIVILVFKKSNIEAPVIKKDNQVSLNAIHCALSVVSPQPNSVVTFPLEVKIIVDNSKAPDCRWTVFEAQAGNIELSDINGPVALTNVYSSSLKTTDEWATPNPVTYTATLTPVNNPVGTVTVKINEEDVKGDGNAQSASYTVIAQ